MTTRHQQSAALAVIVLKCVSNHSGITIYGVADRTGIKWQTVRNHLNVLLGDGMVSRTRTVCTGSGRGWEYHYSITAKGREPVTPKKAEWVNPYPNMTQAQRIEMIARNASTADHQADVINDYSRRAHTNGLHAVRMA